jgi:hypothetical protein
MSSISSMRRSFSNRAAIAVGFATIFSGGCTGYSQKANIEKAVPAAGTLTYQGKPLESYQVTLIPTDGRRPATGITDAAGKFTLGTNNIGDGAPPGTHNVAIVWSPPRPAGEMGQETINDNPANMPKPKVKIPDKYANPEKSGIVLEVPAGGAKDLKIDVK